jgi:hypothetical protein
MSTLDTIAQTVSDKVSSSDWFQNLKKGFGYTPDKQQLSEWKSAQNLKNVYNSKEYNSLPSEKRAKAEKQLFEQAIAPSFAAVGKKAPSFKEWVDFRTRPDFQNNLLKMYDWFDPRNTYKEQGIDATMRVARSFTNLAENLYIKGILHDSDKGDMVTKWLDNFKKAQSHIIDKNSPVNASWQTKMYESIEDMSADFLVFKALDAATPTIGQVTAAKVAGKTEGVVTGALGKFDLAQELAQTKMGRFAMNRLIGAAEGYMYSNIQRTGRPVSDALTFAAFPRGGDSVVKKFLTDQMLNMGPKATTVLMEQGLREAEKTAEAPVKQTLALPELKFEEQAKDVLTTKLTQANAAIYNNYARQMGYSMYNLAPKEVKGKILGRIYMDMEAVLRNPLAHASPELQRYMVEHNLMTVMTPEMEQGFRESAEAMAKTGEKPSTQPLIDEEVAKAKSKEPENNPRVAAQDASANSEQRIVPGAASKNSMEFEDNWPRSKDTTLEGRINQMLYAYGKLSQSDPDGKWTKFLFQELSDALPNLSKKEVKLMFGRLAEHIQDLKDTGHIAPADIRGVFRSNNFRGLTESEYEQNKTIWRRMLEDEKGEFEPGQLFQTVRTGVQKVRAGIDRLAPERAGEDVSGIPQQIVSIHKYEVPEKDIEDYLAPIKKEYEEAHSAYNTFQDAYRQRLVPGYEARMKGKTEEGNRIIDESTKWFNENFKDFYERKSKASEVLSSAASINSRIGELRADHKGNQVLWLTPEALKIANIGVNPFRHSFTTLNGFNASYGEAESIIMGIKDYIDSRDIHSLKRQFMEGVIKALDTAKQKAGNKGIIVSEIPSKEQSLSHFVNTLREEMNHAWQRETAHGYIAQHLSPAAFDRLEVQIPKGMCNYLNKHYSNANQWMRVTETAAKFMSGGLEKFNVSSTEAAHWLDQYFTAVADKWGADALANANKAIGVANQIRKDVYEIAKNITEEEYRARPDAVSTKRSIARAGI